MRKVLFIASAIDSLDDRGIPLKKEFQKIVEESGWEAIGAGLKNNPIIDIDTNRKRKREIISHDLEEIKRADLVLVITDLKTFTVGTWIEMWEAFKLKKKIILFSTSPEKIKNIFITALVERIFVKKEQLKEYLENYEDSNTRKS